MPKSTKRVKKVTTNEAVEQLLGRKAAKRIRQLAREIANRDSEKKQSKKSGKK